MTVGGVTPPLQQITALGCVSRSNHDNTLVGPGAARTAPRWWRRNPRKLPGTSAGFRCWSRRCGSPSRSRCCWSDYSPNPRSCCGSCCPVARRTVTAAVPTRLSGSTALTTASRLTETSLCVELLLTCREGELLAAVAARHGLVSVLTHGECPPREKETSAKLWQLPFWKNGGCQSRTAVSPSLDTVSSYTPAVHRAANR